MSSKYGSVLYVGKETDISSVTSSLPSGNHVTHEKTCVVPMLPHHILAGTFYECQ
jgi:hypothetical protein